MMERALCVIVILRFSVLRQVHGPNSQLQKAVSLSYVHAQSYCAEPRKAVVGVRKSQFTLTAHDITLTTSTFCKAGACTLRRP